MKATLFLRHTGLAIVIGITIIGCPRIAQSAFLTNTAAYHTQAEFDQHLLVFRHRALTEAYTNVGLRSPKWDNLAIRFLNESANYVTNFDGSLAERKLLETGRQIVALGCNDPLILYCYGTFQDRCGETEAALKTLSESVEGLLTSKYLSGRQYVAVARLVAVLKNAGPDKYADYEKWRSKAIELSLKSLQDGSYQKDEQRFFIRYFISDWQVIFSDNRREVYDAFQTADGIDPWIQKVVAGEYWVNEAWKARGSGWASTVTDKGWNDFSSGLAKARTALTAAWKMHPEYPEAAARMITVVMGECGESTDSARTWFERAIQAQFDFMPAYDQYEHLLLPRWGGSHDAMFAFGLECLASRRFDTEVPYQFYKVLLKIITDIDAEGEDWWKKPKVYDNLQKMFAGYLTATNAPHEQSFYLSRYAAAAWRTGHYSEARRLLDKAGNQVDRSVFTTEFDAPFETARIQIYAMTGRHSADLQTAASLAGSNCLAEAIGCYKKVMDTAGGDTNAGAYAKKQMDILNNTLLLNKGAWLTLKASKDLHGWESRLGSWKVEDDGSIVGESATNGSMLVCDQLFNCDLEIKGNIEFVSSTNEFHANGGIAVGLSDQKPHSLSFYLLDYRRDMACVIPYFGTGPTQSKPAAIGHTNTFYIQIHNDKLTFLVNDQAAFNAESITRGNVAEKQKIGIGSSYWYPGVKLRFRNLQVRNLTRRPGEDDSISSTNAASASALPSAAAKTPEPDYANLMGRTKEAALRELGESKIILGPETGYQTYDYPKWGFAVVFLSGKVVQLSFRRPTTYKTPLGIGIGTPIAEVTKQYGNFKRQEEVRIWFGGNVPHVLYYHPERNKYKINYPESDLIFMFDKDKKVEFITVGYIFPVEEDKRP